MKLVALAHTNRRESVADKTLAIFVGAVALVASMTTVSAQPVEPGEIAFQSATSTIGEADGTATITLTRTGGTDGDVFARIDITGGTATQGTDYTHVPGTLDPSLNPGSGADGALGKVLALQRQPDGKIVIGGTFTNYNGTPRGRIARIHPTGAIDTDFATGTGANGGIFALKIQSDGKIVIGGTMTTYDGTAISRLARLEPDGTLDTSFTPTLDNTVQVIALQPDGKILIGGDFTTVNGTARVRLARLEADGTLDTTFDPGTNGANNSVRSLAVLPNGQILVGGMFGEIDGTPIVRIARLDDDGTLDTTFDPAGGPHNTVFAIAVQPTGKIVIGGNFGAVNGELRHGLARLEADGELDMSFNANISNGAVHIVESTFDGKLMISDTFTSVGGGNARRVARLSADGVRDTGFVTNPGASHDVLSIAMQPDGRWVIGGQFTTIDGVGRVGLARLNGDLVAHWPDGDDTPKTISLPIIDNAVVDGNRTVELTVEIVDNGATIGAQATHTLTIEDDDVPPVTVNFVTSTTSNGTYTQGETITIVVVMNSAVTVDTTGGTPTLALDSGGVATYTSGTTNLQFSYTVGNGDISADLDYTSTTALQLNGGTIMAGAVPADLTLATPGTDGSLGFNKDIVIDFRHGIDVRRDGISIPNTSTDNVGGVARTGQIEVFSYSIHNTGNAVLSITAINVLSLTNCTISTLNAEPVLIGVGGNGGVSLFIRPDANGPFSCVLEIHTDLPGVPVYTITVTGTGTGGGCGSVPGPGASPDWLWLLAVLVMGLTALRTAKFGPSFTLESGSEFTPKTKRPRKK